MRDEMKRTMFELFGVGSEDDKVLAAGGKKPVAKPEPVKTAPVQAPVQPVVKAKAASYLAAGTSLEGTLRSDGDVEIAGAFKGEVITTGTVTLRSVIQSNITAGSLNLIGCTLTVSEDSQVTGNINAKELLCAGKVNGDLEITGGTTLEEKAQISGGLVTGTLAVVKGAVIRGGVEIKAFSGTAKQEPKQEHKQEHKAN